VCLSVSESVSLSHKTSWTLYRSQSSTDLHQTCHQRYVPGGVVIPICFLAEIRNISIRQTGSGINHHRCSYVKISLMSNISNLQQSVVSRAAGCCNDSAICRDALTGNAADSKRIYTSALHANDHVTSAVTISTMSCDTAVLRVLQCVISKSQLLVQQK